MTRIIGRAQLGPGLRARRRCTGVQDGPPTAKKVVEANGGARVVRHPRLRDLPTDSTVIACEETFVVSGVGNPCHFHESGVHTRHSSQRTEHVIARAAMTRLRSVMIRPTKHARRVTSVTCGLRSAW